MPSLYHGYRAQGSPKAANRISSRYGEQGLARTAAIPMPEKTSKIARFASVTERAMTRKQCHLRAARPLNRNYPKGLSVPL